MSRKRTLRRETDRRVKKFLKETKRDPQQIATDLKETPFWGKTGRFVAGLKIMLGKI